MAKNNRSTFLVKLVFIIYLAGLVMVTLMPDSENITYEPTFNLTPITSIDNFAYDILENGIINWDFLATKPTDFKEILLYTFTESFKNLFGNIFLFIPLGLLYPLCKKKKVGIIHAAVIILGSTCAIEILQYFFLSSRRADIDDIILNFIGGVIGYIIYRFIK